MAEAFTSYLVDNDRRFRDALTAASGVIEDFRIPFGQILRDFYRSEQAIFTLKALENTMILEAVVHKASTP